MGEFNSKGNGRKTGNEDHRLRVLVVDDDPEIRRLAVLGMQRAGYHVEEAGTAADAVESVRSQHPDLVLLDVGLPDGSGYDVCRTLRRAGLDTPVIIMTLRHELKDRLQGFQAGAQDYVAKPFYIDELVQRVRSQLQGRQKKEELKAQNRNLQEQVKERKDLVDMVAHDLKQPLTSITTAMKMVNEQFLVTDPVTRKLLRTSEGAAENMLEMVDDLLDVGKSEAARLIGRREVVVVPELLEAVRDLLAASCAARSVDCRLGGLPGDLTFISDRGLLFRILVNIGSNAVKVSREGQDVLLECLPRAVGMRFSVSDRGPGIPEDQKARIFEKYVRLEPGTAGRRSGHGIGLFFCRAAVQAMGGRIWVEDREGGGSRFVLEIPFQRGDRDGVIGQA